jgi:hypothetical protein
MISTVGCIPTCGQYALNHIQSDADFACQSERAPPQFNRPGNIMGLSLRTDKLRFTRWAKFDTVAGRPYFPAPFDPSNTEVQYELYDHTGDTEADFDAFENFNLGKII